MKYFGQGRNSEDPPAKTRPRASSAANQNSSPFSKFRSPKLSRRHLNPTNAPSQASNPPPPNLEAARRRSYTKLEQRRCATRSWGGGALWCRETDEISRQCLDIAFSTLGHDDPDVDRPPPSSMAAMNPWVLTSPLFLVLTTCSMHCYCRLVLLFSRLVRQSSKC
jgi:hypothetical protein